MSWLPAKKSTASSCAGEEENWNSQKVRKAERAHALSLSIKEFYTTEWRVEETRKNADVQ